MARQKGKFPMEGTIGGINFYYRKGKPVARASGGGFDGDAIRTQASMVRVRENGSEFGMVSRVKKLIRMSVEQELVHAKDFALHGRMVSLLQQVKGEDLISARGSRSVWHGLKTTAGRKLVTEFLFVPKQPVLGLFFTFPVLDFLGTSCTCGNLLAPHLLFPNDATALVLHYFVVDYDASKMTYLRHSAEKFIVLKAAFTNVVPPFELPDVPDVFGTRMAFLSVQFYQERNGTLYELKSQGMAGLRCLGVFSE